MPDEGRAQLAISRFSRTPQTPRRIGDLTTTDTPSGDSAPVSRTAATSGWKIVRPFYWSGTELASNPNDAWNFNFDNGDQDDDDKDNDNNAAWSVRAG